MDVAWPERGLLHLNREQIPAPSFQAQLGANLSPLASSTVYNKMAIKLWVIGYA